MIVEASSCPPFLHWRCHLKGETTNPLPNWVFDWMMFFSELLQIIAWIIGFFFWKRSMRLIGSLLPCRWRKSKKETLLKSSSTVTGKVRGLADPHMFLYSCSLPLGHSAFLNVSDNSWRSLKSLGGDQQEVGTDRLGTDSGGLLASGIMLEFIV